jgi:hypothetical protein
MKVKNASEINATRRKYLCIAQEAHWGCFQPIALSTATWPLNLPIGTAVMYKRLSSSHSLNFLRSLFLWVCGQNYGGICDRRQFLANAYTFIKLTFTFLVAYNFTYLWLRMNLDMPRFIYSELLWQRNIVNRPESEPHHRQCHP